MNKFTRLHSITLLVTVLLFSLNSYGQKFVSYIETPEGKTEFCSSQAIVLVGRTSETTTEITRHSWSGDKSIAIKESDEYLIIRPVNSGSYTYSYTATNHKGETAQSTVTITVHSVPKPVLSLTSEGITISPNLSNTKYSIQVYRDKQATDLSEFSSPQSGIYRVVITDTHGCSATSQPLTVK